MRLLGAGGSPGQVPPPGAIWGRGAVLASRGRDSARQQCRPPAELHEGGNKRLGLFIFFPSSQAGAPRRRRRCAAGRKLEGFVPPLRPAEAPTASGDERAGVGPSHGHLPRGPAFGAGGRLSPGNPISTSVCAWAPVRHQNVTASPRGGAMGTHGGTSPTLQGSSQHFCRWGARSCAAPRAATRCSVPPCASSGSGPWTDLGYSVPRGEAALRGAASPIISQSVLASHRRALFQLMGWLPGPGFDPRAVGQGLVQGASPSPSPRILGTGLFMGTGLSLG